MNLELVPVADLFEEIERRTNCFVCSYELHEDKQKFQKSVYGKGDWFEAVRLASILNNDVLNNWNNELRTLQKISREITEEEE